MNNFWPNILFHSESFGTRLINFLKENIDIEFGNDVVSDSAICDYLCDELKKLQNTVLKEHISTYQINELKILCKTKKEKFDRSIKHRKLMYIIALALNFDRDKTESLFEKVYFEKAFNPRDWKEIIIYFYIEEMCNVEEKINKIIKMINEVSLLLNRNPLSADSSVHTKVLKQYVAQLYTEEDLKEYILNYQHNMIYNHRTACETIAVLFERVLLLADDKDYLNSGSKVWATISSVEVGGKNSTKTIPIRKEIAYDLRTNFPSRHKLKDISIKKILIKNKRNFEGDMAEDYNEFYNKYVSSEEMILGISEAVARYSVEDVCRKWIILLYSYLFWKEEDFALENGYRSQNKDFGMQEYSRYIDELNMLLTDSNLIELYERNPYDCLFMYCTKVGLSKDESSLDLFQDFYQKIMIDNEKDLARQKTL